MRTVVISADNVNTYASGVAEAAAALRAGQLVIFPTETVYGIAACATHADAVQRLYAAKGITEPRPFTVHVGQRQQARNYLRQPSPLVRRLARRAWPGPLTILAQEPHPDQTPVARDCPAELLSAMYHQGMVGLRCPDHDAATRLLTEAGVPVVASSANPHGRPPPNDLGAALKALPDQAAYAIDGGRTRHDRASTVVTVRDNQLTINRAGALEERTLRRLATSVVVFVCTGNTCRSPLAEYLFRHLLAQKLSLSPGQLEAAGYRICSAGTLGYSGAPASEGSLAELQSRGLDATGHRSQGLTVELIHQADRIYALSNEHRDAVIALVPGAAARVQLLDEAGPVQDPMGGTREDYARAAEQIEQAVAARLEEYLDEDSDW